MTNQVTILTVVRALALLAVGSVAGLIYLIATNHNAADTQPVLAIASSACSALGALLVSTRSTPDAGDPPTPVTVANEPGDPVPVDQTG